MPATVAGTRGGVIGRSLEMDQASFALRLMSGEVAFDELHAHVAGETTPRTVTLVINNSCNLKCAHCYLQWERPGAALLADDEWRRVAASLPGLRPELVCLSGKETFISGSGVSLLAQLGELSRAAAVPFRTGAITNGTLIDRCRDAIVASAPSYFDISLDGIPADHDAVRGQGAFAKAWPNIEWAARTFGDHFFVNVTLQKRNIRRYVDLLTMLAGAGVRNVELGFYLPQPYTAPELALDAEDLRYFFDSLGTLAELRLDAPLRVMMDLDVLTLQAFRAYLASPWFAPERIAQDGKGEIFVETSFANGAELEVRLAPYPTGIWRSVRVAADGTYLGAEDTINTRLYAERSLGNVRDFGYDLARLHAHALASGRLEKNLREYFAEILPVLVTAFGEGCTRRQPAVAGASAA